MTRAIPLYLGTRGLPAPLASQTSSHRMPDRTSPHFLVCFGEAVVTYDPSLKPHGVAEMV